MDQGAGSKASSVLLEEAQKEPLEVNLVAIWTEADELPMLLITIDSLYPGRRLREIVESSVPSLDPERIFLAASHTHQAPMADESKPLLGIVSESFLQYLSTELIQVIPELLDPQTAVDTQLHVGQGTAAHSINRRRKSKFSLSSRGLEIDRVLLAPNPDGIVDENIVVAGFYDDEGRLLCMLWNYACHPVAHPQPRTYASHYPHFVRSRVRSIHENSEIPVLFFQGFSGNTRPNSSVGVKGLKELLRFVISGPRFRNIRPSTYERWTHSLATLVTNISLQAMELTFSIETKRLNFPGNLFASELKKNVTFHLVRLGTDFEIIGVSGEVVADYASYVRNKSGASFVMCVGCIDDTFGYIPTKKMIAEGGYESSGYCKEFEVGTLSPTIENSFKNSVEKLLSDK